jgi:recombinational DNA repair protein RecR
MDGAGSQVQKKIRKCLKCGKEIEEGWLCKKCRDKNKTISEDHFYVVRRPNERYWVGYQS